MIGTIIDKKYQILDEIGTGGMAHVFKAINMTNRRIVAIKMLKSEYKDDAEFLRRFSREAGTVLKLSHENIVRAYEVGRYEDTPYIVMEYVEGHTLKDLIEQNGPLPIKTAIGITCQILDALQVAHAHGIIHRDVKPQNVIVTDRGKAKLTDFGIAREAKATTSTFSGKKVLGSVHYISPEQAKNALATEESDLYSVGVTLYEMLTGTVPFTSDSAVTIALMHIQDTPQPPKELNPDIPNSLNDIVMRALEKNASDRYESARAMRADLVRSIGNPNGTFAKEHSSSTISTSPRSISIYLIIALGVFIPVAAILIGMLIYTTSCQARTDSELEQTVPELSMSPSPEVEISDSPAVELITEPTPVPVVTSQHAPNVMWMTLDDALIQLHNAGYTDIYVTFTTEASANSVANTVISQTDFSIDEQSENPTRCDLEIYRTSIGSYHADVSFTFTPMEDESKIRILYESTNYLDIPYRVVVYESERPYESTDATIAATIYCYDPVTRQVILQVNDEDIASQSVTFLK